MSLFKNAIVAYYAAQDIVVHDVEFDYSEEWDYTFGGGGTEYCSVRIHAKQADGRNRYFEYTGDELISFLNDLLKWEDTK